ncbi:MAG TPA: SMC family ATPase [Thermoleophilaceae bacterium]|nr:SMC family ATPase [Thermoleophilaceae bacterium]
MIPCSVELTDFLSHRCADEPIVFDFDGAVLWSVSGDNGAGKSAIFDAITWTLFNEHRGGSQDAKRLISHGADMCRAAFTFALDGERYRVERSLRRRGASRRSAARWDAESQTWQEIPDTTNERGFARWRDEALGLSFAAFTQSVLLLQGDSDRLIRAGSRERFEILSQLVGLSAYRALEDLARERASEARGRKGGLRQELERLSPVEEDERRAAGAELERLTGERDTRESLRQAQAGVVAAAIEHERLGQRLAATRAEIEVTEKLLASAEQIRAEAGEAAALAAARPALEAAVEALATVERNDELTAAGRAQLEALDFKGLERTAKAAGRDAAKAKATAEAANHEADQLRRALPAVETAILRRSELAAIEDALAGTGTSAEAAKALETCDRTIADLRRALDEARTVERERSREASALEAAIARAEAEIAEIRSGAAEAVCSRCGQEVPAGQREVHLTHAESELAASIEARDAARAVLEPLTAAREAAESGIEAKLAERSRLELATDRAAEHEQALAGAKKAVSAALRARGLAKWDDERAARVKDGSTDGLAQLLDELRAEAERLDVESERVAAEAASAGEASTAAALALAQARERSDDLELTLRKLELETEGQRKQVEIELDRLPASWADRVRKREPRLAEQLDARLEQLADALARQAELDSAEKRLAELRGARTELEAQRDEAPPEHRVAVDAAAAELERRKGAVDEIAQLVEQAQAQLRDLDRREQALRDKREDLGRAECAERLATRMATLLGRQGLQGQLLARAAHDLELLANDTLRALTGGTLSLEIRPEERRNRDEIVISARDYDAGGEKTDAAFLSGSEKFRVCVAMAAAIGKYASGRASIESLIVDEGFGSLDEAGRDDMIDELQRLAGLLRRVIVVSHQGEFQDRTRFPHGYRLHRTERTTEVERYL